MTAGPWPDAGTQFHLALPPGDWVEGTEARRPCVTQGQPTALEAESVSREPTGLGAGRAAEGLGPHANRTPPKPPCGPRPVLRRHVCERCLPPCRVTAEGLEMRADAGCRLSCRHPPVTEVRRGGGLRGTENLSRPVLSVIPRHVTSSPWGQWLTTQSLPITSCESGIQEQLDWQLEVSPEGRSQSDGGRTAATSRRERTRGASFWVVGSQAGHRVPLDVGGGLRVLSTWASPEAARVSLRQGGWLPPPPEWWTQERKAEAMLPVLTRLRRSPAHCHFSRVLR